MAGVDVATAETDQWLQAEPCLSEDGQWWWDGEQWLAAVTADGLWQWDGGEWQPTFDLHGARARDLATTLVLLAEDRYAQAAVVLVEDARGWHPEGELRELVHRVSGLRGRLARLERSAESDRVLEEHTLLDTDHRVLLVRIGRLAPLPCLEAADPLLEAARGLDHQAIRITDGLAAADEAERERGRAIEAAQRELDAAASARLRVVEAAMRAVADAEQDQADETRPASDRLRAALAPPPGEPLVSAGPLRVHTHLIVTPAGRLPAAGARAWFASASALWQQRRDLVDDALLLDTAHGDAFLHCLAEDRRDPFLLLAGRSLTLLWYGRPGQEEALRRLASAVNRQNAPATDETAARLRAADELLAELAPTGEREAAVAAAREALARAQADPVLSRPIAEARARLDQARSEPSALLSARSWVEAEVRSLATPPPPLMPAF
jgi:hypothetical protein